MRELDTIVIHCTATRENQDLSRAQLKQMHLDRGFSDIGYHFYVRKSGQIEYGRAVMFRGAHVKGHNARSIGISYEGGLDADGKPKDTRTCEQIESLANLVSILKHSFGKLKVVGHRDLSPDLDGDGKVEEHEWLKQCPCFNAIEEYN